MRRIRLLLATATLLAGIGAASGARTAQYQVLTFNGVQYTDVVVNGVPETLAEVQGFEARCSVSILPGQWRVDGDGNLGRVGAGAIYNVHACRPVRPQVREDFRVRTQVAPNGRCTFFGSSGSICRW